MGQWIQEDKCFIFDIDEVKLSRYPMTDINKPVNLNEMIKSIIMRIKLIRCIELKACNIVF